MLNFLSYPQDPPVQKNHTKSSATDCYIVLVHDYNSIEVLHNCSTI